GCRCRFPASLISERLRACARLCQRLLVSDNGGVGCILETLCLAKITLDALTACVQDGCDPRQRDPRHQQKKGDENTVQPEQLRGKDLRVERRKPATVLAFGNILNRSDRFCALLS